MTIATTVITVWLFVPAFAGAPAPEITAFSYEPLYFIDEVYDPAKHDGQLDPKHWDTIIYFEDLDQIKSASYRNPDTGAQVVLRDPGGGCPGRVNEQFKVHHLKKVTEARATDCGIDPGPLSSEYHFLDVPIAIDKTTKRSPEIEVEVPKSFATVTSVGPTGVTVVEPTSTPSPTGGTLVRFRVMVTDPDLLRRVNRVRVTADPAGDLFFYEFDVFPPTDIPVFTLSGLLSVGLLFLTAGVIFVLRYRPVFKVG